MRNTILLITAWSATTMAFSQPAFMEPPNGKVYHGTQTVFGGHVGYLAALNDTNIQPRIRGMFVSVPGTRAPANTFNGLRSYFASADSFGFIPEVGLFLVTSNASSTGATDSVIAVSTQYDYFLDSIIVISKNYGKRMFVRIGGEFNGWWNGGGYHPYYYVTAFRKIVNMYAARNFRDSIATVWCYEPDASNNFDSVGVSGPLWYPGDAYVDWFGLDVFDAEHFDQSLPDTLRGTISRKGKSERFLAMARGKGRPVYLNETSATRVTITADSIDSHNDWNNWFAKYWMFIGNHVEIKGFNYINQDWESTGYSGWGDARIQNSTYITNWYKQEMRNPKYIHLPSPLTSVDQPSSTPTAFVLYQNYPNPFNPATTMRFEVGGLGGSTSLTTWFVSLRVFDLLGREVATIASEQLPAGSYTRHWNAEGLASGVYFYRLQVGSFSETKKLLFLR